MLCHYFFSINSRLGLEWGKFFIADYNGIDNFDFFILFVERSKERVLRL